MTDRQHLRNAIYDIAKRYSNFSADVVTDEI